MGMMTEYYHFIFTTLVKYLICANTFYPRWEWEVRRWRRGGRAGWVSCVSCPSCPGDTVRWDGRARAGTCQGREGWMELQVGHSPQRCGCKSPSAAHPETRRPLLGLLLARLAPWELLQLGTDAGSGLSPLPASLISVQPPTH